MPAYDYPDLSGGLNAGTAPHLIQPNEFQELENWYPWGGMLRRRGGVRLLTTGGGWNNQICGLFPLKTAEGTWVMLMGGQTKFGRLEGDTVVDLAPGPTLASISSSTKPWIMFQYKNHAYALRPGHTELVRLTRDLALPAGIAAPTTAMTLSEGAAGDLSAANYAAVVTFGNSETEMESNPSPVSNTLALAADKTIDYASIPVSSNPFVNMRRIYRVLPDQVAEYFRVCTIGNNTDTTYVGDNVGVADLGQAVSFRNGVPPAGLELGAIWNERLFASDGTDLFFSEYLMPEMFSDDVISVFPDDGHVIRGLLGFGDRLLIGKTNKLHYLTGTDRSDFGVHTLSDAHGVVSHHSLRAAESLAFWLGTGKAVYRTDGTTVRDISTPKVKPLLELIPDELEEYVPGAVFPALNWYVLSIPQAEGGNNAIVLIYNYKTGAWTTFTHPSDAPQFIGDFFNTNYGHLLYASYYDGHLYHYHDEDYTTDWGNAISAVLRTKQDDYGYPGYRKFYEELWALIPDDLTAQMQIEVFRDGKVDAILDRTASLNYGDSEWKAWKMLTRRYPGTTMDVRLTYTGGPRIDLRALHTEVGLLPRRPMRAR